jgi:hypothetical protein
MPACVVARRTRLICTRLTLELNRGLHSDGNHAATAFGGAGAQTGALNMCLFLLQFSLVVLVTGVLRASPAGFRSRRFALAESAHKNAWLPRCHAAAWYLQDLFHIHHLCSICHSCWGRPNFSELQTLKIVTTDVNTNQQATCKRSV